MVMEIPALLLICACVMSTVVVMTVGSGRRGGGGRLEMSPYCKFYQGLSTTDLVYILARLILPCRARV